MYRIPLAVEEQSEPMQAQAVSGEPDSTVLLARAKRALEIAIEQDEDAAMEFLARA